MSLQRKETLDAMIALYERMRLRLDEQEKPCFDRAIALMEQMNDIETLRTLALDTAIAVGLSAVTLSPVALNQMVPALATLMSQLVALDKEVRASGSRYSN